MKTLKFSDRDQWLLARRGKITGSKLKDLIVKRGTNKKIGFYELIAERIAVAPDGEKAMDRGTRLEEDAMVRFIKETKKKVDTSLVIWSRDDNDSIAVSPDGFIGKKEAVEAKCLSSALHIKAWLTQTVPDEYEEQVHQYFIVNDDLKTLYLCFYDPRIPVKDFFYLTVNRADIEEKVKEYLAYEKAVLEEVEKIVLELTY
jgi:predicted phage-related endonuclease